MTIDASWLLEVVSFVAWTLFAAWVMFLGGGDWLEDTVTSAFVVHPGALNWGASGIKLYVGLAWIGSVVLWLLGG